MLVQQVFDIVENINQEWGTTIFMVEQNANRRSASPTAATCCRPVRSSSPTKPEPPFGRCHEEAYLGG